MRSVPATVDAVTHVAAAAAVEAPVPADAVGAPVPASGDAGDGHVPVAPNARVRVLLFASYRDLAGTGELEVRVRVGDDVAAALAEARARAPGLERLPQTLAVAVNGVYADFATALADGDEIALLPPVAGG
ncbi:MAG: MoaD/ThiS family protein [Gemmatimonadota bacterium]